MGLCVVRPRVKDGSSASSTGTLLLDSYNLNVGRKGLVLGITEALYIFPFLLRIYCDTKNLCIILANLTFLGPLPSSKRPSCLRRVYMKPTGALNSPDVTEPSWSHACGRMERTYRSPMRDGICRLRRPFQRDSMLGNIQH